MQRHSRKKDRGATGRGGAEALEGKKKRRIAEEQDEPQGEKAAAEEAAEMETEAETMASKKQGAAVDELDEQEEQEEEEEQEDEDDDAEEEKDNDKTEEDATTDLANEPVSMSEALECARPAASAASDASAVPWREQIAKELTREERLRNLEAAIAASQKAQDVTTRKAVVARPNDRGLFLEGVVTDASKRLMSSDGKPRNTLSLAVDRCTIKGGQSADCLLVSDSPLPTAYVWPTTYLSATPEEVAINPNAKGKPVMDMYSGTDTPCMTMHAVKLNFFDEETTKKKFEPADCTPGSRVSVSCCKVVMRRNKETQVPQLFLNGASVMPIDTAPPGTASARIREFAMLPAQQHRSALALAAAAGGWAHVACNKAATDAAKAQAQAVVDHVAQHQKAVLESLEKKVEALTSGELASSMQDASKLASEYQTIKRQASRKSVDELCAGMQPVLPYNSDKEGVGSEHAWLVQEGRFPSDAQRGLTHPVLQAAIDDEKNESGDAVALASQPNAGCVAWVSQAMRDGNFLRMNFEFQAYYDKERLVQDAMGRGEIGFLTTYGQPAVCAQLGMKEMSLRLTGTRVAGKAAMAFSEILPYANMALQVEVAPRCHNEATLSPAWARGASSIEFHDGVLKAGIPVKKSFLIAQWLDNKDAYIHKEPKDGDGVATVETPPSAVGPDLAVAGCRYQAISECSFEFPDLAPPDKNGVPDTRPIVYRVVIDGCGNAIRALRRQGKIGADVQAETAEQRLPDTAYAAGEEMLVNMCGEEETVKAMIKSRGIVYAVRLE